MIRQLFIGTIRRLYQLKKKKIYPGREKTPQGSSGRDPLLPSATSEEEEFYLFTIK